ncbi:MAG TPA: hypothetical protein VNN19_01695 [bacterium]|nr:hypothetical protein [bacterium]
MGLRGERDGHTLAEAAEAVIRRLRGVQAVRVEGDGEGGIRLVHVLGGPDRSAKVIAVDVISALAAELGIELEPRQVRVAAQRRSDAAPAPDQLRLRFVGLSVAALRSSAEVKVQLEEQGLLYEGIASGPNARANRLELVGEATLRAVELFLRSEGMFLLEGVSTTTIGPHEVAVAVVALPAREEEILCGSAVVRDDPREAVVRAVLDAINRPVSWLVARRPS